MKINRAYEVLKDEDLRKKYDKYGEKGLEDQQQGGRYESWNYYRYDFGELFCTFVIGLKQPSKRDIQIYMRSFYTFLLDLLRISACSAVPVICSQLTQAFYLPYSWLPPPKKVTIYLPSLLFLLLTFFYWLSDLIFLSAKLYFT